MLTLTFLAKTVIDLYVMVLLLRIWMQWVHSDFYKPIVSICGENNPTYCWPTAPSGSLYGANR